MDSEPTDVRWSSRPFRRERQSAAAACCAPRSICKRALAERHTLAVDGIEATYVISAMLCPTDLDLKTILDVKLGNKSDVRD